MIVNGFTPSNKSETETLCKAIKLLNVQVILIIDNEKLEKEISMCLKSYPNSQKYKVIKVPKSPGIQSHHRLSAEETSTKLYEAYLDYFKGRFSEIFSKSATWREMI